MPIAISLLTEGDIPGAIDCIQCAFANDPYNRWVFSDRSKVSLPHQQETQTPQLTLASQFSPARNSVSLRIRCQWGIRNALFYVAKDNSAKTEAERNKVLGVAMWMPPRNAERKESWDEWVQAWLLWGRQVWMNLWWGRGGLNVKVGVPYSLVWCDSERVSLLVLV